MTEQTNLFLFKENGLIRNVLLIASIIQFKRIYMNQVSRFRWMTKRTAWMSVFHARYCWCCSSLPCGDNLRGHRVSRKVRHIEQAHRSTLALHRSLCTHNLWRVKWWTLWQLYASDQLSRVSLDRSFGLWEWVFPSMSSIPIHISLTKLFFSWSWNRLQVPGRVDLQSAYVGSCSLFRGAAIREVAAEVCPTRRLESIECVHAARLRRPATLQSTAPTAGDRRDHHTPRLPLSVDDQQHLRAEARPGRGLCHPHTPDLFAAPRCQQHWTVPSLRWFCCKLQHSLQG